MPRYPQTILVACPTPWDEHDQLDEPTFRAEVRAVLAEGYTDVYIFGTGGARRKAEELNVPFLGEVPIQIAIRERGDAGETTNNFVDQESAPHFERICYSLVKNIAMQRAAHPPLPFLAQGGVMAA